MKRTISITTVLVLSAAGLPSAAAPVVSQEFVMPENDLWMEDDLSIPSQVSKETFERIISIGYEVYSSVAKQNNETLVINSNWDDSTVNAGMMRRGGIVTINLFGGLARRSEITPEAFAAVLCHELGHAYGGRPFLMPFDRVAAEGQADYYGAGYCLPKMLQKLESSLQPGGGRGFVTRKCDEVYAPGSDENFLCVRRLDGGLNLSRLLSVLEREPNPPTYETPDLTVVNRTELSYPATVQCRLDTHFTGTFGLPRPACWYRGNPDTP
jgi:hypothetical protein